MEWDSDLNCAEMAAVSGEPCCTPKEGISRMTLEEITTAFTRMSTSCTPNSRFTTAPDNHSRLRSEAKRRVLFKQEKVDASTKWSEEESYALVLFLLLHTDGKTWVARKDHKFWAEAGKFVKCHSKSAHCRTGQ